jgi:hypothetical protein
VDALIPLLRFEIDGDAVFRAHMSPMLESFQDAFYRYLRGSGHPNDPLFSAFTVQEGAAADPNYRARRFVKVLSGIHLLPPTTLRLFKVRNAYVAYLCTSSNDTMPDQSRATHSR